MQPRFTDRDEEEKVSSEIQAAIFSSFHLPESGGVISIRLRGS
jgi:hypothetical protein